MKIELNSSCLSQHISKCRTLESTIGSFVGMTVGREVVRARRLTTGAAVGEPAVFGLISDLNIEQLRGFRTELQAGALVHGWLLTRLRSGENSRLLGRLLCRLLCWGERNLGRLLGRMCSRDKTRLHGRLLGRVLCGEQQFIKHRCLHNKDFHELMICNDFECILLMVGKAVGMCEGGVSPIHRLHQIYYNLSTPIRWINPCSWI